jgi:4-methyl-5(b-hydroxyethyl)-thiazole monophosphate biosynthesis
LAQDPRLLALLTRQIAQGRRVAAICAAPTVLAQWGFLNGRRATAYPGFLELLDIPGLVLDASASVVMDGPIITSRGPGTAMDFGLFLIEQLTDLPTRTRVEDGLQRPASQRNAPIMIV